MFYSDCTSCKIVQFVDKSSINYISPLFILVTELKTICKRFFCLNWCPGYGAEFRAAHICWNEVWTRHFSRTATTTTTNILQLQFPHMTSGGTARQINRRRQIEPIRNKVRNYRQKDCPIIFQIQSVGGVYGGCVRFSISAEPGCCWSSPGVRHDCAARWSRHLSRGAVWPGFVKSSAPAAVFCCFSAADRVRPVKPCDFSLERRDWNNRDAHD